MWVPGSIIFLVPAAIIVIQFLSPRFKSRVPKTKAHSRRGPRSGTVQFLRENWLAPAALTGRLIFSKFRSSVLRAKSFRRGMQAVMLIPALAIVLDGSWGLS